MCFSDCKLYSVTCTVGIYMLSTQTLHVHVHGCCDVSPVHCTSMAVVMCPL